MKPMNLDRSVIVPSITFVIESDKNGIERRRITVVHGVCMYQSTGNNSKEAGTWFPFLGLNYQDHPYFTSNHVKGYLFKPIETFTPSYKIEDGFPEVYAKMIEVFPKQGSIMAARFGSLYNMLVSSQFGGGLWETAEGKTFKNWLEESHSHFYQHFPKLKAEAGPEMRDGIKANQWMSEQGGDFKKIPLKTKKFKAHLDGSDIIGKTKNEAKDYVISWLNFIPKLAKKHVPEQPPIKSPFFSFPSITLPSFELPSFAKSSSKPLSDTLPNNIAKSVFTEIESRHISWEIYRHERQKLLEPTMEKLIKLSKKEKMDESTRKQEVGKILYRICSNSKKYASIPGGEQVLKIANEAYLKHFGHDAQVKQETRKSVILNPDASTSRKMTADKENKVSPDSPIIASKTKPPGQN